jgi:hypothetical protein
MSDSGAQQPALPAGKEAEVRASFARKGLMRGIGAVPLDSRFRGNDGDVSGHRTLV